MSQDIHQTTEPTPTSAGRDRFAARCAIQATRGIDDDESPGFCGSDRDHGYAEERPSHPDFICRGLAEAAEWIIAGMTYREGEQPMIVAERVKIPGGPDNQGAVSSPFTITVNAVPAASLVPSGG